MNLFRIDTIARNNNLIILQGTRCNGTKFSVYISRYLNINSMDQTQSYLYTAGTYYIITIVNTNQLYIDDNRDYVWDHINYNNNDFPYYLYGIADNAYFYIKGLILT